MKNNDAVLDFGCGEGFLLYSLPAKKKVGIEANPHAIEHARSLGLKVYSDINELKNKRFNKIISSHVLAATLHSSLKKKRQLLTVARIK
ncbi:class I SAM-dependent methyltransferase [Methylacidiphilum kamchatkense]|uniref:class I SAM-dependent methyltransferase n=1 Tax=Methylacidiphilum kamchatkense TaxID=431057 RepID=UPI00370479BE